MEAYVLDTKDAKLASLINLLLDQPWHKTCEFVMEDKEMKIFVKCRNNEEFPAYLRYSKGPRQGFSWDIYGDDMQTLELAIIALSKAPAPVYVGPITFNLPLKRKG